MVAEQLELERKREAELDLLHREEAARMWERREREWGREREARERLMSEVRTMTTRRNTSSTSTVMPVLLLMCVQVLAERQKQLCDKMESLKLQQV